MSPDLSRLCEAAEAVLEESKTIRPTPHGDEDVIDMEVIVRAVLEALRQTPAEGITRVVLSGVIDQILADPGPA